jgi:hypothetical protein
MPAGLSIALSASADIPSLLISPACRRLPRPGSCRVGNFREVTPPFPFLLTHGGGDNIGAWSEPEPVQHDQRRAIRTRAVAASAV